ncbi:MAG TPA: ATP-binding protein [Gaiellaceae bacterium]|nr:ATP-binding protein [Gaiellaceae bacterium]
MEARRSEFADLFADFVREALQHQSSVEPEFRVLLREHLGADPRELAVVAEQVADWDHGNLQLGLEAVLAEQESVRLVGIGGGQKRFMSLSLSDLVNERHFKPGSVEYENVEVGPGVSHPCVLYGLALVSDPSGAAVLLVRRGEQHGPDAGGMQVEAMSPVDGRAAALLARLRAAMRERNVFRGQMFSLQTTLWGQVRAVFHERPGLRRDEVVLPEALLRDVERHTIAIGRRAEELRAAGRHLKRGLLLHGPPGTGKTHTVRWLAGELSGATTIVLSGGALGVAGPVCRLARELAPSLVVLEDVDLVADERTMPGAGGYVLFELLNELDGMADDADVAVVLTTNRPDLLEPALAARPGRVDLAVEVPLPDEECRRRLLDLYASGLTLELARPDEVVARTAGVTASFFRELMRQAALEATDGTRPAKTVVVQDEHVAAALDRLLAHAGTLTRILLGAEPGPGGGVTASPGPRAWLAYPQPDVSTSVSIVRSES